MRNEGIACGDDFFYCDRWSLNCLKNFKQIGSVFLLNQSKNTQIRCFNVGANIVRPLLAELTDYFQTISTIQNQV